jgi:hypothetical protein
LKQPRAPIGERFQRNFRSSFVQAVHSGELQVMKKVILLLLLELIAVPTMASLAGKSPSPEVLGIRLSMSQKQAHARTKRTGSLEKEERKRQEVWALRDPRVSHLIVGFDPNYRVRYVTAIARTGGPRIRYIEVGDLKNAEHASNQGNHKFTWKVAAGRGHPAYIVVAHGRDPRHLDSYSVKRLDV